MLYGSRTANGYSSIFIVVCPSMEVARSVHSRLAEAGPFRNCVTTARDPVTPISVEHKEQNNENSPLGLWRAHNGRPRKQRNRRGDAGSFWYDRILEHSSSAQTSAAGRDQLDKHSLKALSQFFLASSVDLAIMTRGLKAMLQPPPSQQ